MNLTSPNTSRLMGRIRSVTDVASTSSSCFFLKTSSLHVHEDHEAPAESSHQEHGDVHAVYEDLVQDAEVQPAMSQEQQDDREFVLEAQDDAHEHILEAQQRRERHPQERREHAAAEVKQEAHEAVGPARLQVQVEVAVVGAQ